MKNRSSPKTGVLLIRWVVVPVMVLSGGFLVASNLVLQTRAARGWFERKLEKRSGLDWTIRYLSWSPWTGVQVGGVTADLPDGPELGAEPIYAVEEIDVEVYWGELLKGVLKPREVVMRNVRAAVPIELTELLPPPQESSRPAPPAAGLAGSPDPGPPGRPGAGEASPPGKKPGGKGPGVGSPAQGPAGPGPKNGGGPAPAVAANQPRRPPAGRPVRFLIEDCEVKVYSLTGSGERALALRGVGAEVPLGGEDSEGWLRVNEVTMGEEAVSGPFRATLQWTRPFLVMPAKTFEWSGLKMQVAASVQAHGVPLCNAEVRLLPGALEPTPVALWPDVTIGAANVKMRSRFRGNLIDVPSWQGDSVVELTGVDLRREGGREDVSFDFGTVTAVMQGRTVQVVDARLLSERLSFLGNGIVLPDGRLFGIVRVVADREYAESLTKVAVGSFLARGWTQSWLGPLQTPDRHFRDIHFRGTTREATVDVGKKGEVMPVEHAWERMLAFLKQEAAETRQGVPQSPPRERIWIEQSQ